METAMGALRVMGNGSFFLKLNQSAVLFFNTDLLYYGNASAHTHRITTI